MVRRADHVGERPDDPAALRLRAAAQRGAGVARGGQRRLRPLQTAPLGLPGPRAGLSQPHHRDRRGGVRRLGGGDRPRRRRQQRPGPPGRPASRRQHGDGHRHQRHADEDLHRGDHPHRRRGPLQRRVVDQPEPQRHRLGHRLPGPGAQHAHPDHGDGGRGVVGRRSGRRSRRRRQQHPGPPGRPGVRPQHHHGDRHRRRPHHRLHAGGHSHDARDRLQRRHVEQSEPQRHRLRHLPPGDHRLPRRRGQQRRLHRGERHPQRRQCGSDDRRSRRRHQHVGPPDRTGGGGQPDQGGGAVHRRPRHRDLHGEGEPRVHRRVRLERRPGPRDARRGQRGGPGDLVRRHHHVDRQPGRPPVRLRPRHPGTRRGQGLHRAPSCGPPEHERPVVRRADRVGGRRRCGRRRRRPDLRLRLLHRHQATRQGHRHLRRARARTHRRVLGRRPQGQRRTPRPVVRR